MRGERRSRFTIGLWSGLAIGTVAALALILLQKRLHEEPPASGVQASATEPSASTLDDFLSHIRAGTTAYRDHRYGDAVQPFEAAKALQPTESLPYRYLAELYWREGKPQQAAQALRSLASTLSDAYALDQVGRFYEEAELRDLAIQTYQEAIRLDPRFPSARYNLGRTYLEAGDVGRGIAEMQAALDLHPNFPEAHQALGMAYTEQGRFAEAIVHLGRALAIQPGSMVVRNHLGRLYMAQGRLEEAIQTFRILVDHAPDVAEARHNLAVAYARQGLQDLAIDQFTEALRLRPDLHAARLDLATLFLEMGRAGDAIAVLQAAFSVAGGKPEPDDARDLTEIRYRLGVAYARAGRWQQAIQELQAVLQGESMHAGAHAHLGYLYYQTRQFAQAWRHARRAESLGLPMGDLLAALRQVSVEPQ